MNLKELNILLKDIALSRKSINEYNEGDVYQNLNNGEHKYANINFTINSTQVLSNNVIVVNCYLFYIDRLLEDSSNKLDIWTVGANTLNQILNAAKNNSGEFFDFGNLTYTNFTEKFADLCAGVYANVDIQILGNISECDEEYVYRDGAWDKGYASGFTDGYASGLTAGYEQGFEDGVESTYDYLWMQALTDDAALGITLYNETSASTQNIQYSYDKIHWVEWDFSELDVNSGDTIYLRGYNPEGTRRRDGSELRFVTSGLFDCGGSIISLYDGCGKSKSMDGTYMAFLNLFSETNITNAPYLSIYSPGLYQYFNTFRDCKYLSKTPKIEIGDLSSSYGVFRCTFLGCTSLVEATLCFKEITKGHDTCWSMFDSCSSLSSITSYIEFVSSGDERNQLDDWLNLVAEHGKFYNLGGYNFQAGKSGIPTGWTEYRLMPVNNA